MLDWQSCNYLGHPFHDLTTSFGFFPSNGQKFHWMHPFFFFAILFSQFYYCYYLILPAIMDSVIRCIFLLSYLGKSSSLSILLSVTGFCYVLCSWCNEFSSHYKSSGLYHILFFFFPVFKIPEDFYWSNPKEKTVMETQSF